MVLDIAKQSGVHDAMAKVQHKLTESRAQEIAKLHQLPYIDLMIFPVDLTTLSLVAEREAREGQVVAFFREHNDLRVGLVDPENQLAQEVLARLKKQFNVTTYIISPDSLLKTLVFYSKIVVPVSPPEEGIHSDGVEDVEVLRQNLGNSEWVGTSNQSQLLSTMFSLAIKLEASDIHLEPEKDLVRLRMRVDGVLNDIASLPKSTQVSVLSRIKLLAHLKLNVTTVPQDGRLSVTYQKSLVDVRVSVLPTVYGEAVVMRLLGVGMTALKISDLGLIGRSKTVLEKALGQPNGAIFTTGPTGSGKTTTLYACLQELNKPGVKIITLEDPVEYRITGVEQTPIDTRAGLTFAAALRSVLRQDPDAVMVGEIRDKETADTALQAALTGHIVLSTLHTNDAAGAVPRLFSMGVEPFVIAPALNLVMAQRLVRRLCQYCRKETELPPELAEKVSLALKAIPHGAGLEVAAYPKFFTSPGCKRCSGLGYKGRVGVYEALEVTSEMRDLILKQSAMLEMKKLAVKQGMASMQQDGLVKATLGLTDVEEVVRVTGAL